MTRYHTAWVLDSVIDMNPDTGCDWWPSCLNCPYPECRHDLNSYQSGKMHREIVTPQLEGLRV